MLSGQRRYLRGRYKEYLQKKKTKPIVTLASAHPDHETVSFGKHSSTTITYMALLVYDKTHQGSESEHRADKGTRLLTGSR